MAVQANLPTSLPALIGREGELDRLHAVLGQTRLLTLTGPGGVGKTRLAQQLACDIRGAYTEGVWWADLATLEGPGALGDHLCATIGVPDTPRRSAIERLQDFLGNRKILLALDNCEHLVEAVAHLCESFLAACPAVEVLATSRETLGASYESIWPVPPLATPPLYPDTALTSFESYGAVALFVYRARTIEPHFALNDQNRGAVARVCRRLDGLPLALELAASYLNALTVEQLDMELDRMGQILLHGRRTAPDRQRSLKATIEWSYNWLSADEQALFRRLCALRAPFDLELAEKVGDLDHDATLYHLKRLVDQSMVQALSADVLPRYRILQTLAQFGRDRLSLAGEEAGVYERYCDWAHMLVEPAFHISEQQRERDAYDRLEPNISHLRAIFQWMLDNERVQDAVAWVTALQRFWRERGYVAEAMRWLEAGLAQRDTITPLVRARALEALGVYASWQSDNGQAKACCQEALLLFGDLQLERGVAMSLFRLGSAEQRSGEFEEAITHLRLSLEAFASLGDAAGLDMARYGLGLVALAQRDARAATSYLEECLDSLRARGDVGGCAATLLSLGVAALERDEYDEAERWLNESLEHNRTLKDWFAVGYALVYLGQALHLQGRGADAHTCLSEALALVTPASTPELLARLCDSLAVLAASASDLRNAAHLWGASESIHTAWSVRYWPAERERQSEAATAARRSARDQAQEKTFVAAWAAGRAMALEEALALASDRAQKLYTQSDVNAPAHKQLGDCRATLEAAGILPLRIQALGAVHIERGEYEITSRDFTYSKARELLFYLLLHGPRAKQQIGLALWPDLSEEQLRTTFRVVVYHLRRALGHSHRVLRERGRYHLARITGDWNDVVAFETAIAEAERLLRHEPNEAIARLEAARSLYRGDFCEDMTASDWIIEAQNELRQRLIFVLLSLGGAYLERSQPRRALERFKEALTHDRYREDAHRGVLRTYVLLQEHAQAARYYQQLRLQFERELGIALAPETRAVLQSIC